MRPRPGAARRGRVATIAAWAATSALAGLLVVQRYREALAGGVGIDLDVWLAAARVVRGGGDPYTVPGYTYTPLMAWLLLPLTDRHAAMAVWTAASLLAGLLAIAFVVMAHRRRLPGLRAPLLAAVAAATLMYSRVLTIDLYLGQAQLLLLSLLALAALLGSRRPALSAAVLAIAALLKTWPAIIGVWLARKDAPPRIRAGLAALGVVVAFCAVWVWELGPGSVGSMIATTIRFGEQPLNVYSVWYFSRQWPPSHGAPTPVRDAPPLGQAITAILLLLVVGLIILAVLRPDTPSLALWNIAAATTLLIPVSHPAYRLLVLPLLWVWCAELLGRGSRVRPAIAVAVLSLWWVLGFRVPETTIGSGWPQFAIVVATFAVVALSTVLAALRGPDPTAPERAVPSSAAA